MADLRILSDHHITRPEDDWLQFRPLAEAIADLVEQVKYEDLPITIGLMGEWGSGKTSLMHYTQSELTRRSISNSWFNPWKYDRKEALWYALIMEVLSSMKAQRPSGSRLRNLKSKATDMAVAGLKGSVTTLVGTTPLKDGVKEALSAFSDHDIESHTKKLRNFVNEFENIFRDLVRLYVGENGRFVVFIDDLDRCSPDNAITVLESLKLFMDKAPCVFIIGADMAVIQQGVTKLYGSGYASRDYIDKIVQVSIRMPQVPAVATDRLWIEMGSQDGFIDSVKELVRMALGDNLRQWKRFINSYTMTNTIASRRRLSHSDAHMAARAFVVLLAMRFPALYDEVSRDSDGGMRFFEHMAQDTEPVKARFFSNRLDSYVPYLDNTEAIAFCRTMCRKLIPDSSNKGLGMRISHLKEALSSIIATP